MQETFTDKKPKRGLRPAIVRSTHLHWWRCPMHQRTGNTWQHLHRTGKNDLHTDQ